MGFTIEVGQAGMTKRVKHLAADLRIEQTSHLLQVLFLLLVRCRYGLFDQDEAARPIFNKATIA